MNSYYRIVVGVILLLLAAKSVVGYVHPVSIRNRHFIDTVTNEPVSIKLNYITIFSILYYYFELNGIELK